MRGDVLQLAWDPGKRRERDWWHWLAPPWLTPPWRLRRWRGLACMRISYWLSMHVGYCRWGDWWIRLDTKVAGRAGRRNDQLGTGAQGRGWHHIAACASDGERASHNVA